VQTGEVPKVVADIRRRKQICRRTVRLCERGSVSIAFPTRWRSHTLFDANGMELARQHLGVPTLDELREVRREWDREQAQKAEWARRIAERAVHPAPVRDEWSSPRRDSSRPSWWNF